MRIPASSAQLEIHGSALVRPGFDSQASQVRLRAGVTSSRSSANLATAISSCFRCAFALAHLPCTHAALSEPARPLSALTKPPARVSRVLRRSIWLPQSPPPSPLPSPPPPPLFLPSKPPPLLHVPMVPTGSNTWLYFQGEPLACCDACRCVVRARTVRMRRGSLSGDTALPSNGRLPHRPSASRRTLRFAGFAP